MITVTFETQLFRVQIVGKSAWVESSEGTRWIFRTQHCLPIATSALQAGADRPTAILRSAVDHFEKTRKGDLALREALTGVRSVVATPPAVRPTPNRPALKLGLPTKVAAKPPDFRSPLRPPLAAQSRL
jgi:hypothetical protein